MSRRPRARSLAALALGLAAVACAAAAPVVEPGPGPAASAAPVAPATTGWEGAPWGRFHSKRFSLWLSLPDGKGWKINDHRGSWLVATHAATSSSLSLRLYLEDDAVNRARCEAHARQDDPALPASEAGRPGESRDRDILPGWDAHSQVTTTTRSQPRQPLDLEGHLVAFGALVRRCVVVHYATRAQGPGADATVGTRLGEAARIVRDLEWLDERQGPGREPPLRSSP